MKILNRYITKEFINSFIISILVIYAILLIQLMIKLLDKFLGKGFSFSFLVELLFYNTAWILAMAVPMAVLVASILTYGKLAANNEIVGFNSSGIRTRDLLKPSAIISLFITLLMVYFSCNILPEMNHVSRKLNHQLIRTRPDVEFEEDIYSKLIPNHIIKFKRRNKLNKSKFHDIIIHQTSNNKLKKTIVADSVIMISNNEDVLLDLYDGTIHERITVNEEYREIDFKNYKLSIPLNKFSNQKMKYIRGDRELTYNMLVYANDSLRKKVVRLKKKINKRLNLFSMDTLNINYSNLMSSLDKHNTDKLSKIDRIEEQKIFNIKSKANKTIISGYLKNINRSLTKINKNKVEIHKKFAIPIATIIFLLIGAPLGIILRKGNLSISMAISLMFFILYYILIVGGEQLADKNLFNPILSMWLPNLIILIFGLSVIKVIKK
jgi:lipopolysaccharide export system permease protein